MTLVTPTFQPDKKKMEFSRMFGAPHCTTHSYTKKRSERSFMVKTFVFDNHPNLASMPSERPLQCRVYQVQSLCSTIESADNSNP